MKIPPINWDDLLSMGLDPNSSIFGGVGGISISPPPNKLISKLISAAIVSPPPDEDRMMYLRHVRDILMSITDWTQLPDSPLSIEQKSSWANYRQSLRDLPSIYNGDGPISWPQSPII